MDANEFNSIAARALRLAGVGVLSSPVSIHSCTAFWTAASIGSGILRRERAEERKRFQQLLEFCRCTTSGHVVFKDFKELERPAVPNLVTLARGQGASELLPRSRFDR